MAASLGSLVVSLGLDAAEFVTGLSRSEYQAKRFAERLDRDIARGAKAAGVAIGLMASAAGAAFIAIDRFAKGAAQFKDLEEITGAAAEDLASFAVAAEVADTEMRTVAESSVRLTKAMTGVDDESKAAGAALAALGLSIKEFKQLDPAAQIEAVAKAMGQFEDGAGKTAVAMALFGRAGAQILPFLKELEQQGGRQRILTQQQIEQADEYADAQARAKAQLELYAQAAATQALPAITALIQAARDFIAQLSGINAETGRLAANNGVREFAENAARAFAFVVDAGDGVIRIFRAVGLAIAAQAAAKDALRTFDLGRANKIQELLRQDLDALLQAELFSTKVERQLAQQRANEANRSREDRGFRPQGRQVQFAGPQRQPRSSQIGAERISEAERYLEALDKQLERTQELTVAEQALRDIEEGRLKGITPLLTERILNRAAEIDAAISAKRANEEAARAEEDRTRATIARQTQFLQEADRLREQNDALRDEISLIGKDVSARYELEQAHLADAIARAQNNLEQQKSLGATDLEIQALQEQINLLRERRTLLGQKQTAEIALEEGRKAKEFYDQLGGSIASAFEEAIVNGGKLRDILRGLEQDLVRIITRKLVTEPLANAISGALQGGNFLGSILGQSSGGGGFGSFFSSLFGGLASGTDFWRGGPTIVGERGPEAVNLPRGAQVIPNDVLRQKRAERAVSVNNYITVPPGTTRSTADQLAVAAGQGVQRALRRNS